MDRRSSLIARALKLDLTHAQTRYVRALREELRRGDRWLDLGCGHQIVPEWALPYPDQIALARTASLAVGVDADSSIMRHAVLRLRARGSGYHLPFRDASFDLVTANMVMEHVESPCTLLGEVARVLEPSGRFMFHTPNRGHPAIWMADRVPDALKRRLVWWLEHRVQEDVFPTFYRMNTEADIRRSVENTGLRLASVQAWGSVGTLSAVPVLRSLELPLLWLLARDRFRAWQSNFCVKIVRTGDFVAGKSAAA
jgi:ubiquinone/menaquinone biosynthesis C-methylase UbiE